MSDIPPVPPLPATPPLSLTPNNSYTLSSRNSPPTILDQGLRLSPPRTSRLSHSRSMETLPALPTNPLPPTEEKALPATPNSPSKTASAPRKATTRKELLARQASGTGPAIVPGKVPYGPVANNGAPVIDSRRSATLPNVSVSPALRESAAVSGLLKALESDYHPSAPSSRTASSNPPQSGQCS